MCTAALGDSSEPSSGNLLATRLSQMDELRLLNQRLLTDGKCVTLHVAGCAGMTVVTLLAQQAGLTVEAAGVNWQPGMLCLLSL